MAPWISPLSAPSSQPPKSRAGTSSKLSHRTRKSKPVCCEPADVQNTTWAVTYFFRLSRHQKALHRVIASGDIKIVPDSRRNEILAWIDGLEDFSISRSATRARGWGLPVP